MASIHKNIGNTERILSVWGGAYLLYNTVVRRKSDVMQTLAGTYLLLRGVTGICLAYRGLGKTSIDYKAQNINIRTSMTVNRPRDQVYASWRRIADLPNFMKHLKKVEVLDETTSEWTAFVPGNMGSISWKSEIVKDDPGALLSWHSMPGSTIENAGKVTFNDAHGPGTEVEVVISYHAPLGILGEKAGRLLNPVFERWVRDDIRNFKTYMETSNAYPSAAGPEGNEETGYEGTANANRNDAAR